jgi:ATP-binding cassette subfamily C protein
VASTVEGGRTQQHLTLGSTLALAAVVYGAVSYLAIPTATLLVLLFVFARLMPRATGLYERVQFLLAQLPAFDRVNRLTHACESAAEPADDGHARVEMAREIRFDRVTFDYESRDSAPALRSVALTIPAGAMTAIVGPSGAGKSTVADLLLGLVTPSEGHILIDGRPLRAEQRGAWRARLGYVPQDTFLFHDTVRANLVWARPEADEAAIWRALELAAAEGFVASLPDGLETVVGDRGVLLSGGERQRLALARALLRDPEILVLDEATSALDAGNEARILSALERLRGRLTIVMLTHRLSAVRDADVVHVLEKGEVVESGTVVQLMARPSGRFRAMWRAQDLDVEIGPSPTALLPG